MQRERFYYCGSGDDESELTASVVDPYLILISLLRESCQDTVQLIRPHHRPRSIPEAEEASFWVSLALLFGCGWVL